ncbi:uncharacterized protein AB9W97_011416 [Spinachia spinachia]
MGFKSCVRDRISFFLLILGTIATDGSGQSLECTNNFSKVVSCHVKAQNCTEYSLTLKTNTERDANCNGLFTQCGDGQCCCSITNVDMVLDEIHTVTVWKGNKSVESNSFQVKLNIKPNAPTIRSVEESNGNFQVLWDTNMEPYIGKTMEACLTYHKKGDTKKVSERFKPSTTRGLNVFNILGLNLERSTTYVVSVKSYTSFSGMFSDSSNEWEFTTDMSPAVLPLIVIGCLSFAAVILTSVIYVGCVKVKTEWSVSVSKCPNPKLGVIYPSTQKVLKPGITDYSIVCVENLVPDDNKSWLKRSLGDGSTESLEQSSGINTGSSCISYPDTEPDIKAGVSNALSKLFPNIVSFSTTEEMNKDSCLPVAYQPCQADDMCSPPFCFSNQTYSTLIPSQSHQIPTNSSDVQTQPEIPCDFGTCVDPQAPSCLPGHLPPGDPPPMPTDMSYQQRNADSGGVSYAHGLISPSVSSGTNGMMLCDALSSLQSRRCEGSEEAGCGGETEGFALREETPSVTAGAHSFPPVDYDYQPLQDLAAQPHVSFFDGSGDKKEGHLNRRPEELFTEMPEGASCFINDVQDVAAHSLMPADPSGPLVSDSGYQRA